MVLRTEMPFIEYEQLPKLMHQLNQIVMSGSLGFLSGPFGCGKSRLLKQWVEAGPRVVDPHQMAIVKLSEPLKNSFGDKRLASPMTLIAFSRLWYVLQRIPFQQYQQRRTVVDQQPAPLYTDHKYLDLLSKVQAAIETLQIRAIIFDDAQYMDVLLLEQLMLLRESCPEPFAIIFCSQLEEHANTDKRLGSIFKAVRGAPQALTSSLILALLQDETFYEPVLPNMFLGLGATITAEVEQHFAQVAFDLRNRAQGNWRNINQLATFFDEELPPTKSGYRPVSLDVVRRVLDRFDGIAKLVE